LPDAVLDVVREAVVATKAVRYEGNNYAQELVEEARRRGLPNLRTTPEALAELVKPQALDFLARTKVFSKAEAEARYHVRLERYVKDVDIEVECLENIVSGHVLPAGYKQLALLSSAGAPRPRGRRWTGRRRWWTSCRRGWPSCSPSRRRRARSATSRSTLTRWPSRWCRRWWRCAR